MDRIERARRELTRDHPVLGRLASFLKVTLEPGLGADVETSAQNLRFNAHYAAQASAADLQYWLAHATLHAALLHFVAPPGSPDAWSQACDAKVERLLRAFGIPSLASPAIERHAWWLGMAKGGEEAARSHTLGVASDAQPSGALPQLEARSWRIRVRQAVGEALGTGDAHAALVRELCSESSAAAAHDWRERLAAFMQRWHRAEAHYGRPSRRASEPFLLPALRPAAANIVLAVDISASIDETLLRRFWAEVQALAGQIPMRLTLLAADTRLAPGAPWRFAVGEVPSWPKPHGQGGTDFRPVFDWIEQSSEDVDALVYFTDGRGDYPLQAPSLPVLWVVAGSVTPPFGEVIRL